MKRLLHVGCNRNTKENTIKYFDSSWSEVRLDINKDVKPDIIGSMTDLSNVKKNSYDAVFSSHSIEHLFAHEVEIALKEFHSVLNEDGFVVITCPDLKSVSKLVIEDKLYEKAYESPAGPISPIDMIYGHRGFIEKGDHYMSHKSGFTLKNLLGVLKHCGFQSVAGIERPNLFDLWVVAKKKKVDENTFQSFVHSVIQTI
tara:strand:- start:801 stop:1400 length:600 start_codon:yes stop_codon:yes gene_type:complete